MDGNETASKIVTMKLSSLSVESQYMARAQMNQSSVTILHLTILCNSIALLDSMLHPVVVVVVVVEVTS